MSTATSKFYEEGAAARRAGKDSSTYPYADHSYEGMHWRNGWWAENTAQLQMEAEADAAAAAAKPQPELRGLYAAAALIALLPHRPNVFVQIESFADDIFIVADAMLAARERR